MFHVEHLVAVEKRGTYPQFAVDNLGFLWRITILKMELNQY